MSKLTAISQAAMVYEQLRFPFPVKAIKWRIGARNRDKTRGSALAYIDARNVMERLDQVVGLQNWQTSYGESAGSITTCTLSLRINDEWIYKTDGAGKTQVEGEKGAISDALKRAAVQFGIGRYLYLFPDTWVELESEGTKFANTQELVVPDWATPEGWKRRVLKITDDDDILTDIELADLNDVVAYHTAEKGQQAVDAVFGDFKVNTRTIWTRSLMESFVAQLNNLKKG